VVERSAVNRRQRGFDSLRQRSDRGPLRPRSWFLFFASVVQRVESVFRTHGVPVRFRPGALVSLPNRAKIRLGREPASDGTGLKNQVSAVQSRGGLPMCPRGPLCSGGAAHRCPCTHLARRAGCRPAEEGSIPFGGARGGPGRVLPDRAPLPTTRSVFGFLFLPPYASGEANRLSTG
jgi:hypothetical protein